LEQTVLILTPQEAADTARIQKAVAQALHLPSASIRSWRIVKRSVDARQRQPKILLTMQVFTGEEESLPPYEAPVYRDVSAPDTPEVNIIGLGPAGLFAALSGQSLSICVGFGLHNRQKCYIFVNKR